MEQYIRWLKSYRKKNGEKLLPLTIKIYSDAVRRARLLSMERSQAESVMCTLIKKRNSKPLQVAFKRYCEYREWDIELPQVSRRASALTSERMLGKKVLSKEEVSSLIKNGSDNRSKLIFSMLIDTGCRANELISITLRDIKLTGKRTQDRKCGIYAKIEVVGKGGKRRTVCLGKKSVLLLKEYFKEMRDRLREKSLLFEWYGNDGKPTKHQYASFYNHIVREGMRILGKKIHPHQFRHTCATFMASEGADALDVKEYLGHSDINTAMIYTHASSFRGVQAFGKFHKEVL